MTMTDVPPSAGIRLGAIGFINTIPIYDAFESGLPESGLPVKLVYDNPAALNRKIQTRQLDVSPVSSAYYLAHQSDLVLLDDLSVSSFGSVQSVLFVSQKPLDRSFCLERNNVIPVPDDSETSVNLLAAILKEKTGQSWLSHFQTYPAGDYHRIIQAHGSALVIGDHALLIHEAPIPKEYHVYDLSNIWVAQTGLPFVFAVWVAQKSFAENYPNTLAQLNQALCASRNRFFENPDIQAKAVDKASQQSGISTEKIHHYYHLALNYQLGELHQQSLRRFETIVQANQPVLKAAYHA